MATIQKIIIKYYIKSIVKPHQWISIWEQDRRIIQISEPNDFTYQLSFTWICSIPRMRRGSQSVLLPHHMRICTALVNYIMEYIYYVAGTDDEIPTSHFDRVSVGGHYSGTRRFVPNQSSYPRMQFDMESQIHQLEQEAYRSVLRAFKAQSDAISWVNPLSFACFHIPCLWKMCKVCFLRKKKV